MLRYLGSSCIAFAVLFGSVGEAWAQPTPREVIEMERRKAIAEAEARQEIELLFARLCPGRCELIDVKAAVKQPEPVGQVSPGFGGIEGAAGFAVELKRVDARIMLDSELPPSFRKNVPLMLRYRLSSITENVVINPVE
ncbi:MAG: hypothetical protein AAGI01_18645, partial [Myxococcota bacterium]